MFFTSKGSRLYKAIKKGNLQKLQKVISEGVDLNKMLLHETLLEITPVGLALECGRTQILEELLKKGADANRQIDSCRTPLQLAISKKSRTSLKLLLEHGATPNTKDSYSRHTPLIQATIQGSEDMVRLLLAHGADVNAKDLHHDTALIFAAKAGHPFIVSTILEYKRLNGLDDSDVNAAIYYAKTKRSKFTVEIIDRYIAQQRTSKVEEDSLDFWKKISEHEVAHITSPANSSRTLTDIFNFSTRERFMILENARKKTESISAPVSFNDVNKEVLDTALKNFTKRGGKASVKSTFKTIKK